MLNIRLAALGAVLIGAVLLSGCNAINTALGKADLPTYSDIGAACESLSADAAEASQIREIGNRVACEAFAGVEAYGVAQQAVISLQEQADGSGDDLLISAAIKAGELDAKLSPVAQSLNRSIDAFIFVSMELARYREEGRKPPQVLLIEAASTYATLAAKWDEAKPILKDLQAAL